MKTIFLTMLLLLLGDLCQGALIMYDFKGSLTYSNGNPFGADGTGGVSGSFIYNDQAVDSNSDPNTGEYIGALIDLYFTIDSVDFEFTMPGNVRIFNDIQPSKFDIFNLWGTNVLNTTSSSEVLIQHTKIGGEWLQSDRIEDAGVFQLGGSYPTILQLKNTDTGEWQRFDFYELNIVPEPSSVFLFSLGGLCTWVLRRNKINRTTAFTLSPPPAAQSDA